MPRKAKTYISIKHGRPISRSTHFREQRELKAKTASDTSVAATRKRIAAEVEAVDVGAVGTKNGKSAGDLKREAIAEGVKESRNAVYVLDEIERERVETFILMATPLGDYDTSTLLTLSLPPKIWKSVLHALNESGYIL